MRVDLRLPLFRTSPIVIAFVIGARALGAQYPLVPSPVLDPGILRGEVRLGGYVSIRETIRRDSSTFNVNQARITVTVAPSDFATVKLQGNLAALGRTTGDTIPGFVVTDAYVQLAPPNERTIGGIRPTVILGQFKTPFSLEYLTGFSLLQTAGRSQVVEQLAVRRDVGVMVHLAFRNLATLAGTIVNGEGPNSLRNANGKQLAAGRLTVMPAPSLAVAGKWAGEGADHRWGYDVRWMMNGLVLEGERIERRGPINAGIAQRAAGRYLMASYRVGRHLQPVVKWEQMRDTRTEAGVTSEARLTWTTYGLNIVSGAEAIRFQANWIVKRERPTDSANELVGQLIVIF
ncbi:MAG TPA: porin [Gemmatimonadaceae bacterium]|nr:porin [Gemmatimonadaceae bacterium]